MRLPGNSAAKNSATQRSRWAAIRAACRSSVPRMRRVWRRARQILRWRRASSFAANTDARSPDAVSEAHRIESRIARQGRTAALRAHQARAEQLGAKAGDATAARASFPAVAPAFTARSRTRWIPGAVLASRANHARAAATFPSRMVPVALRCREPREPFDSPRSPVAFARLAPSSSHQRQSTRATACSDAHLVDPLGIVVVGDVSPVAFARDLRGRHSLAT